MAGAIVRELLRRGPLQVEVGALALAKALNHAFARTGIDRDQAVEREPALVAGVLEHRHRLRTVIDEHLAALQPVPAELRFGRAADEEKAVHLVDLCKVQRGRLLALLKGAEALRGRGLGDVDRAIEQAGDRRGPRRRHRMPGAQVFLLEKAARHGGDERRVERRKTRELNADVLAHEGFLQREVEKSLR